MASGEYNGRIGENIPEFDGDIARPPGKTPTKPTREDIRDLLETKIFLFNFSFNAVGSNKPDSTVDRKRVPYKKIAEDLYKTYRLYKAQSNKRDYSLTPQTYVAYIKGKREEGIAAAKQIIVDAKKRIKENHSEVDEVHIIASLAIVYDEQHRPRQTHTIRN